MTDMSVALHALQVFQEYGVVRALDPQVAVETESGVYPASRAASCLLVPQLGDRVLIARDLEGEAFVLAILTRPEGVGSTLELPGDAQITAPHGSLALSGRDALGLSTAGTLDLSSAALKLGTLHADLTVDGLNYTGTWLQAHVARIKLFARTLDSMLERVYQVVSRSHRRVEQLDEVRAGQIEYRAETTLALRGEQTVVTGKTLAKVDAAQIHLG